jgi:hypothetical protein
VNCLGFGELMSAPETDACPLQENRHAMPIACDAERPVQAARRQVTRATEGK